LRYPWTPAQRQRLRELNAPSELLRREFTDSREREKVFLKEEQALVENSKRSLYELKEKSRRPKICELESALVRTLIENGFVQVLTPIIISKASLKKMSIDENHPLFKQIFWVDERRCLRPMLAPNLYFMLRRLRNIWEKPIRIFEVGPCFRKDTGGRHHLEEFTMLNLVELGLEAENAGKRLEVLATMMMKAAGIENFHLLHERSEVYGETVDIVSEIECASGAMGPHPLDEAWGISEPWVGIGIGLERILLVREKYLNIQRAGRALIYLDGVRLNI